MRAETSRSIPAPESSLPSRPLAATRLSASVAEASTMKPPRRSSAGCSMASVPSVALACSGWSFSVPCSSTCTGWSGPGAAILARSSRRPRTKPSRLLEPISTEPAETTGRPSTSASRAEATMPRSGGTGRPSSAASAVGSVMLASTSMS